MFFIQGVLKQLKFFSLISFVGHKGPYSADGAFRILTEVLTLVSATDQDQSHFVQ